MFRARGSVRDRVGSVHWRALSMPSACSFPSLFCLGVFRVLRVALLRCVFCTGFFAEASFRVFHVFDFFTRSTFFFFCFERITATPQLYRYRGTGLSVMLLIRLTLLNS